MLCSGILAVCCPFQERAAKESATKRAHHRCPLCFTLAVAVCRAGSLYGELARFVPSPARLQGKPQPQAVPGGPGPMMPGGPPQALPPPEGPSFDSVWGN